MIRKIVVLSMLVSLCGISSLSAQEKLRVMVFPFDVYSQKAFIYLETEIPKVITEQLQNQGAIIVTPDLSKEKLAALKRSPKDLKKYCESQQLDYIVWGSLTWIDDHFSIDAKLLNLAESTPPRSIFVQGNGIDNLLKTVNDFTNQLELILFKRTRIVQIRITGNKRIEADAIKRVILTKPGDAYNEKNLNEDLKSIYKMGYFEDIRVESEDVEGGKIVTFKVSEKPTIKEITIKGNSVYNEEEIREVLTISKGSILNIYKIRNNITRIEDLYKKKNYHNVKVTYNIIQQEDQPATLEFVIEEGDKIMIKKITFEGNSAYTAKEIRKKSHMKTEEKGFFSFITSSGEMNDEDLKQDIAKIAAFYHNNGYIMARVSDPIIDYKGDWIYIKIKIEEGPRFKVGTVDITGDMIKPKAELLDMIKIKQEEYYNREVVRSDILKISDLYSDKGYANVDVAPQIDRDMDKLIVNLTYNIIKGKQVYFEKIIISGNTKTRDKVIRRELNVYEQGLYSSSALKRSVRNLYRLDFFEDIKVNTLRGSDDEKMILKFDVTEKPTGTFTFGGGYSSVDKLFATASISQRNLFGKGQVLQLQGQVGASSSKFNLSFTEPWLFDIPLSARIDLYNWARDYDTYTKDSTGGGLGFGYPIWDFTTIYLSYNYSLDDIYDIDYLYAPNSVSDLEGRNVQSSMTASIRYDSRDRVFNPTEGFDNSISVEYAGGALGGDFGFVKYQAESGWYFPIIWETVGFLHGKIGCMNGNYGSSLPVPDWERYYLGGMNSIRGYKFREISPTEIQTKYYRDENGEKHLYTYTDPVTGEPIPQEFIVDVGGNKYVQFNVEYLFPLLKDVGLVGVLFYDTGNVFNNGEDIKLSNMRESVGFGFRWYSPMGPIRLENGYILHPREEYGESSSGRWDFTMGTAF